MHLLTNASVMTDSIKFAEQSKEKLKLSSSIKSGVNGYDIREDIEEQDK
jgi:predicted DNA-binding protein